MKKLLVAIGWVCSLLLVGCSTPTVSEQDAQNFSKTPDGKNDGLEEVNNNR